MFSPPRTGVEFSQGHGGGDVENYEERVERGGALF